MNLGDLRQIVAELEDQSDDVPVVLEVSLGGLMSSYPSAVGSARRRALVAVGAFNGWSKISRTQYVHGRPVPSGTVAQITLTGAPT